MKGNLSPAGRGGQGGKPQTHRPEVQGHSRRSVPPAVTAILGSIFCSCVVGIGIEQKTFHTIMMDIGGLDGRVFVWFIIR